eukprot:CFRG2136T1
MTQNIDNEHTFTVLASQRQGCEEKAEIKLCDPLAEQPTFRKRPQIERSDSGNGRRKSSMEMFAAVPKLPDDLCSRASIYTTHAVEEEDAEESEIESERDSEYASTCHSGSEGTMSDTEISSFQQQLSQPHVLSSVREDIDFRTSVGCVQEYGRSRKCTPDTSDRSRSTSRRRADSSTSRCSSAGQSTSEIQSSCESQSTGVRHVLNESSGVTWLMQQLSVAAMLKSASEVYEVPISAPDMGTDDQIKLVEDKIGKKGNEVCSHSYSDIDEEMNERIVRSSHLENSKPKLSVTTPSILDDNVEQLNQRPLGYWEEIYASREPMIWFEAADETPTTMAEGESGTLSASSFNQLVALYIRHFGSCATFQVQNFTFPKTMLRAHLWFSTSPGLLRKIIEIYDVPKDHPEQQRIRNAVCQGLRFWMQQQILDFISPDFFLSDDTTLHVEPEMQCALDEIFCRLATNGEDRIENMLKATLDKQLQQQSDKKKALLLQPIPEEVIYKDDFESLPIDLVAEQLTLIEFEYFHAIQMRDLKLKLWTNDIDSCPILKMIVHFNSVSTWVVHTILTADTLENGAKIIDRFRTLACILKKYHNYNTMMAIDGALQHTAVERLYRTLHELSDKKKQALQELKTFTSPLMNYKKYREVQSNQNGFCIPYIGLYLRDMLHTDDALQSWMQKEQVVNFKKMRRIAESAWEIYRCQEIVPPFTRLPILMQTIRKFLSVDVKEDELYELSYNITPRDSNNKNNYVKKQNGAQPIIAISQSLVSKRSKRPKKTSIHSQSQVQISSSRPNPQSELVVNTVVDLIMCRYGDDEKVAISDEKLGEMIRNIADLADYDPLNKDSPRPIKKAHMLVIVDNLWTQASHLQKKGKFASIGKSRAKLKAHKIIQQIWEHLNVEEELSYRSNGTVSIDSRDSMDLRAALNSPKTTRNRRRGFSHSVATDKPRRPSTETITSGKSVNQRKLSFANLAGQKKEKVDGPSVVESGNL